jgi:uncharacterized protein (TIGR01777 family)
MFLLPLLLLSQVCSGLNFLSPLGRGSKPVQSMPRVVITGASGVIGTRLCQTLRQRGVMVLTIGRGNSSDLSWDVDAGEFSGFRELEGVDAVIHLAGENVGSGDGLLSLLGRWSPAKKQRILESRVKGTRLIVDSIKKLQRKPKVFLSMSGVGVYGFSDDEVKDESSSVGDGFLAYVCQQWENEALKAERIAGMRTVLARQAVVLTTTGGVLAKLAPLFSLGGGGNLGSGLQPFCWVSLEDTVRALEFILENSKIAGAVNICSPTLDNNAQFTSALGSALSRPTIVPLPEAIAGIIFGQMGQELLLGGQKAAPAKLTKAGFQFLDADINAAVAKIIKDKL